MHLFLEAKDSNQKDYKFEEMKQKMNRKSMEGCFGCPPFLKRRDFLIKSPLVAEALESSQTGRHGGNIPNSPSASECPSWLPRTCSSQVCPLYERLCMYLHNIIIHHIFVYILDEIERTGLTYTTPLKGS